MEEARDMAGGMCHKGASGSCVSCCRAAKNDVEHVVASGLSGLVVAAVIT